MQKELNPKDYATYEEYLAALKAREKFQRETAAVDQVFHEAENDEDLKEGMEALGFTYYDDEESE